MNRTVARTSTAILLAIMASVAAIAQTTLPVINVTVQYTGKAQVTDKTPLWVFLFNTPNPGAETPPLAVRHRLARRLAATPAMAKLRPR